MKKEQFKDEILLLYRESYFAKAQYILLTKIYKEILIKKENNPQYLLSTIFDAIEFSLLLKLTKIYDTDPNKQSITLLHILNKVQSNKELNYNSNEIKNYTKKILDELNSKESELNKIKTYRDKVISHLDKKYPKGLLSIKSNEQIDFDLLKKYVEYSYNTTKRLYEIVFNELLLDSKQFEIIEKEYEFIKEKLQNNI